MYEDDEWKKQVGMFSAGTARRRVLQATTGPLAACCSVLMSLSALVIYTSLSFTAFCTWFVLFSFIFLFSEVYVKL